MEDATISEDQEGVQEIQQEIPDEQQPLYQQGKYPSIIDTDDLVFEIGKQTIGNLNKEKLLDNLLKKSTAIEQSMVKAEKEKMAAENKVTEFELSNKQYVDNNKKLDGELVKLRNELKELKEENKKITEHLESKVEYLEKKF